MKLLWLTWKDLGHPDAGGAEVVCAELTKRLVADGWEVTILTCGYKDASSEGEQHGAHVIRVGSSRYGHPFQALWYYVRRLRNKFDVVIEEVNGTAPYFAVFFGRAARRFLLYHQLGRKNWLYETKPPLAQLGYHILAPAATRLVSRAHVPVITVSESTRTELARHGFSADQTFIISEGIEISPLKHLDRQKKFSLPTMLSLGSMRAMKRTIDQIEAFEHAKTQLSNLQLRIAGNSSGDYGKQVMARIERSPYKQDITYEGSVSPAEKLALMRQSHVIVQTAIEEGWGLTITEAASQGTPAIAYNVAGLRDSIRDGETGILTIENPTALATGITALLTSPMRYEQLRRAAWQWSKQITFDQSYRDFKQILEAA